MLSGRGLCDELITRPEESYRMCCVVVRDLETSRMGAPYIYIYIYIYIYDISRLRVKLRETVTVVCDTTFSLNNCINHTRHVFVCFFWGSGGVYSTAHPLNYTTASNRRIT